MTEKLRFWFGFTDLLSYTHYGQLRDANQPITHIFGLGEESPGGRGALCMLAGDGNQISSSIGPTKTCQSPLWIHSLKNNISKKCTHDELLYDFFVIYSLLCLSRWSSPHSLRWRFHTRLCLCIPLNEGTEKNTY